MMLTEVTAVPTQALPVLQFRDHLRLGTGFADDGFEDALLETYLRAAIAAVEAWTGKALLARDFALEVQDWTSPDAQTFPVAPVSAVGSVFLVAADGAPETIDPARYRLVEDTHVPELRGAAGCLPTIPFGGRARLAFTAGFGADWGLVPQDLAHAVLMLAAYYYEYRHEARIGAERIPYGVSRLISSWRVVRLGRGAAR
jgi:uncharacterized phiE125 gp8 family phage protein